MVYLNLPGPGGGGGGGGNQNAEPPRQLQLPGRDAVSIPVPKETPLEPLQAEPPAPTPEPPPRIVLPAMTTSSGAVELDGAIFAPPQATMAQGSGSAGGAGSGKGTGSGPGDGPGLGAGRGGGTGGDVYRPGAGIEPPQRLVEVKPEYTSGAMHARIQGTAWLECIVNTDGRCTDIRVTRSLDSRFGLDQEAIKAASQWQFEPGRRLSDGLPVPVLVSIAIDFTVH